MVMLSTAMVGCKGKNSSGTGHAEGNRQPEASTEDSSINLTPLTDGFPLPLQLHIELKNNFYKTYLPHNSIADLNLRIPLSNIFDSTLGIDTALMRTSGGDGVILHYAVEQAAPGPHYSYIISYGKLTTSGLNPIPVKVTGGENFYLHLKHTTTELVNQTEFDALTNYYKNNVKLSDYCAYNVAKFVNQVNYHPLKCYYDSTNLIRFMKDNAPLAGRYLHVFNAAVYQDLVKIGGQGTHVQTPILAFGDNTLPTVSSGAFDHNKPYKDRALDVGRLCPPNCNKN